MLPSKCLAKLMLGLSVLSTCAQTRHALVIGNDSYAGNSLANARNDASAVSAELKKAGYDVTLVLDANRSALSDHVDSFVDSLHPGDTATLYYAGHGMQMNGENYLVPVDFKLTSQQTASEQGYPLSSVLERFTSHGATTQIVILDACRDNPFLGSRSEKGGWAGLGTSAGAFIAFGTSPGSTASDAPGENHGLFTKSLLRYLTASDLDIEEMFRKVREDVIRDSQGKQVPWVSSSLIGSYHVRPELDVAATRALPKLWDGAEAPEGPNGRTLRDVAGKTPIPSNTTASLQSKATSDLSPAVLVQLTKAAGAASAGQTGAAVQILQAAVSANPGIGLLYRLLGLMQHTAGQDSAALASFGAALAIDSNDARALAYQCALEGLTGVSSAPADCAIAVRIQPSADSFLTLAAVQQLNNDSDRALVSASQSISIGGSDLSYALRGAINVQSGRSGAAQRDFSHATEIAVQPDSH